MPHDPLFKKPGSSRYWCRVPNPNGGRHLRFPTGHQDRASALARWRELCRQSVTRSNQAKDSPPVGDAVDAWLEERKQAGKAAATLESYGKKARHVTRVFGTETPLDRVDAAEIDRFIALRLEEGAKPSTVAKELVVVSGTLRHARRRGEYPRAVDEVMPVEFSPKYKPKERALSEEEIRKLLDALPIERAACVAFIIATAATYPSELLALTRKDVDLEAGFVRIRGTKRAGRDRIVPIVPFARYWIEQSLPYVPFPPWGNIRRDLHRACAKAAIAPCSPNDLRRTMLTLMRARGAEPSLLGAFAGHKDSRMVERVYGRLQPTQLAALLNDRLGGQPGARLLLEGPKDAEKPTIVKD